MSENITDGLGGADFVNTHVLRLQRENVALRERLAALVDDSLSALRFTTEDFDEGAWKCCYCHESGHSALDVPHAPDCPITRGRAALLAKIEGYSGWYEKKRASMTESEWKALYYGKWVPPDEHKDET